MVVKTIKLTSLFVNTENYRFEPLSSQKEAIDKMVEDQGDKGSPDKPGGLSIQLCKSEKKEFYIRYSS